jgi:hypothetical protein
VALNAGVGVNGDFTRDMAGKDHVIAGSVKNTAQVAGAKLLPETARAGLHAAQTRPDQDG